jgi:hypothetical protein
MKYQISYKTNLDQFGGTSPFATANPPNIFNDKPNIMQFNNRNLSNNAFTDNELIIYRNDGTSDQLAIDPSSFDVDIAIQAFIDETNTIINNNSLNPNSFVYPNLPLRSTRARYNPDRSILLNSGDANSNTIQFTGSGNEYTIPQLLDNSINVSGLGRVAKSNYLRILSIINEFLYFYTRPRAPATGTSLPVVPVAPATGTSLPVVPVAPATGTTIPVVPVAPATGTSLPVVPVAPATGTSLPVAPATGPVVPVAESEEEEEEADLELNDNNDSVIEFKKIINEQLININKLVKDFKRNGPIGANKFLHELSKKNYFITGNMIIKNSSRNSIFDYLIDAVFISNGFKKINNGNSVSYIMPPYY